MTILNATPHSIDFYDPNELTFSRELNYMTPKNENVKPVKTLETTFTFPLKVHKNYFDLGIEIETGIFLKDSDLNSTRFDPLPFIDLDNDILVVSDLYGRFAAPKIDPRIADILYTPDTKVKRRQKNGDVETIGCCGLKKVMAYMDIDFYINISQNYFSKLKALEYYKKCKQFLPPQKIESLNCLEAQILYWNTYAK